MTLIIADIQKARAELTAPGATFELHDISLDGQSYKAFKNAQSTLTSVLQAGRNHGDAEFLVYEGERYTFQEFFTQVDALAASMQLDHGVCSGDRVAIAMRNCPEWGLSFVAAVLIGAIPVPINSWGKSEELEYAITDSGANLLICDEQRARLIHDRRQALGCELVVARSDGALVAGEGVHRFEDLASQGTGRDYHLASPDTESPCMILYTSGSTGSPKGVVIRHIAMTQAIMNLGLSGMLVTSLNGPVKLRAGSTQEASLATVPLFHATGLIGSLIMPILSGNKSIIMYKWDALQALQIIQQEKVTTFGTVPTVLQDLLSHPDFDSYNTESLLRLGAGGAASPETLPELINRKVREPVISTGWGMTETIAVGAFMSGGLCELAPHSAGIVSPLIEIRFVDGDQRVLPSGDIGEIELRSVCCTPGYWGRDEATAAIFSADRWMKTGDLGRLDENGYLHITGRIKEIVIRGGENIYPGEIENAAYAIDGVHEAAVFGMPNDTMGEELAMTLYIHPDKGLDEAAIRSALDARLAGYKVPKYITISGTPLPQNASGKLHRLKVREAFLENLEN